MISNLVLRLAPIAGLLVLSVAAPAFAGPGDKALADVEILSSDAMQGRAPGTPGSAMARAHILKRFGEIGLAPIGASFEQPFSYSKRDGTRIEATNLVARIPGTAKGGGKVMVVSAHYDHLGVRGDEIFNGADDNASGVAGLLAVAEAFKAHPPQHDVILAVVDAEEGGLRGSRAFVAHPPVPLSTIALAVNFDMLSKNSLNELYVSGAAPFPSVKPILDQVAATAQVILKQGHDTDADGKHNNWTDQSDHFAFGEKGVPWVYFGVEDHPEYHKSTDDFATIPQDFFRRSVATVIAASLALERNLDQVSAR